MRRSRSSSATHEEHPLDGGAPSSWLRARLGAPDAVSAALLGELAAEGGLVVAQGRVRRAGFMPSLDGDDVALGDAAAAMLEAAGTEPPSIAELASRLGERVERIRGIVHFLAAQSRLVAVDADRFYHPAALDAQLGRLAAGMVPGREHAASELRELLGVSRKYLIPLLEYCDQAGYALRNASGGRRWNSLRDMAVR